VQIEPSNAASTGSEVRVNCSRPLGEKRHGLAREHLVIRGAWSRKTQRGNTELVFAHLLIHLRTRVLNDELAAGFQRWYPAFVAPSPSNDTERAA
jgi:hypothetical protein